MLYRGYNYTGGRHLQLRSASAVILTFTPDSFSHKFQHIIQKATTSDASLRYVTVAELYQEIQEIQKLTGQPHLIHKIAVLAVTEAAAPPTWPFHSPANSISLDIMVST